MTKQNKQKTYI